MFFSEISIFVAMEMSDLGKFAQKM